MSQSSDYINIAVVDDHNLFRKGLINLIQQVDPAFKVIAEAQNGREFLDQLQADNLPDIVIMDVSMPVLDGYKTTALLKEKYSNIGILALTMMDDEITLIRLLKAGVNGYLNKDIEPDELKTALFSIAENGYYYTEYVAGKLVNIIRNPFHNNETYTDLSEQELKFIELSCSEHTYKMIADKMCLSIKTIDGYRGKLFEKLQVKSRVGLVLYALKNNLISLDQIG